MLITKNFCGYCDEALTLDTDLCINPDCDRYEDSNAFATTGRQTLNYAPSSVAHAKAFLNAYPEFAMDEGAYITSPRFEKPEDYDTNTFALDTNSPETSDVTREDEWDGIYSNRDLYERNTHIYATYRDVEPDRCTHATNWWTNTRRGSYNNQGSGKHMPTGRTRRGNVINFTEVSTFVSNEALDFSDVRLAALTFTDLTAMNASVLIDYGITAKYQDRFFNVFMGKYDNYLHIGGVRLEEGSAYCTRCKVRTSIPDTNSRDTMESFVHSVIRHGNNHRPSGYRSNDSTFIHADVCNGNHKVTEPCQNNKPVIRIPSDITALLSYEEVQDFLIQHRQYCRTTGCRCTHYYHLISEKVRNDAYQGTAA